MRIQSILASAAVTLLLHEHVNGIDLCKSKLSNNYQNAMRTYPYLKSAIEMVGTQPLAKWYTDRVADLPALAKEIFAGCSDGSPVVVVYGLPGKDCQHGFSADGQNKNAADYRRFLNILNGEAKSRRVVYILEPDAVGLLTDNGCGNGKGYSENLKIAFEVLGANPNADIYLDVGYWTLGYQSKASQVADVVKRIDTRGRCKGVSLNTSNYRPVSEMGDACQRFASAAGKNYKCIVDTSRNFKSPGNFEWCNAKSAGIGQFPTKNTGHPYIDYFVWIKPPGESDGQCDGRTDESMKGASAGQFFPEHFVQLWNNGIYVNKYGLNRLEPGKIRITTPADVGGKIVQVFAVKESPQRNQSLILKPNTTVKSPTLTNKAPVLINKVLIEPQPSRIAPVKATKQLEPYISISSPITPKVLPKSSTDAYTSPIAPISSTTTNYGKLTEVHVSPNEPSVYGPPKHQACA
jgi:hypothetical protein